MNNEERSRIKFPLAAVFVTLTVILQVVRYFRQLKMYQMIGFGPQVLVWSICLAVLAICLYMKKRGGLLIGILAANVVILLAPFYRFLQSISYSRNQVGIWSVCAGFLYCIFYAMLAVYAYLLYYRPETAGAETCKTLWFIPGILELVSLISIFIAFGIPVNYWLRAYVRGTGYMMNAVNTIPMGLLLGWWITHPYKKEAEFASQPQDYFYQQNAAERTVPETNPLDGSSTGIAILSFLFPIIGLILYLSWKNTKPLKAASAGKGAAAGVIAGVVLGSIGRFM